MLEDVNYSATVEPAHLTIQQFSVWDVSLEPWCLLSLLGSSEEGAFLAHEKYAQRTWKMVCEKRFLFFFYSRVMTGRSC